MDQFLCLTWSFFIFVAAFSSSLVILGCSFIFKNEAIEKLIGRELGFVDGLLNAKLCFQVRPTNLLGDSKMPKCRGPALLSSCLQAGDQFP